MFRRAPWYQRFGLDHNQQLLDALLPWWRGEQPLIRPAKALAQKLSALANSAPTATSVHSWRNRVMTS
jgi:type VI secretion system protein ImpL